MNVYFFIIVICVLLSYIAKSVIFRIKNKETKSYKCTVNSIYFLFLFILMGFRDISVGTDTELYCNLYQEIIKSNVVNFRYFDKFPVYTIYCKLISFVSNSNQCVIICNSLVILSCMAYVFYNLSENISASWFLYFATGTYLHGFNTARQHMAMALVLVSCCFLIKKRKFWAILFELLAIGTHSTAIVGIVPILVLSFHWIKEHLIILGLIELILLGFVYQILELAIKIFPSYRDYLLINKMGTSKGNRMWTALFIVLFYFLVFSVIKRIDIQQYLKHNVSSSYSIILLIALISMFVMRYNNMASRIEMYFYQFLTLAIPPIINKLKIRNNRIIVSLAFYAIIIIPCFALSQEFLPYIFF